jgi:hypothetical protein
MTEKKEEPKYEIETYHSSTDLEREIINKINVKASTQKEVKELYLFAKEENNK